MISRTYAPRSAKVADAGVAIAGAPDFDRALLVHSPRLRREHAPDPPFEIVCGGASDPRDRLFGRCAELELARGRRLVPWVPLAEA